MGLSPGMRAVRYASQPLYALPVEDRAAAACLRL